jgi:HlyD family secretion protein
MKKKIIIATGVFALITIMVGVSIYRQAFAKGPEIDLVKPKMEEISDTIMVPGTLELTEEQVVYLPSPDVEIDKVVVKEGQKVEKGQMLLTLKNPQLNSEMEQIKLSIESGYLKINQIEKQIEQLENKEKELQKQVGKEEAHKQVEGEYDQLEVEKRMANLELKQQLLQKDSLEEQIKELEIKSNIKGTVLDVNDQWDSSGIREQAVVHVGELEGMAALGLLSEFDALKVKPGQRVTLSSDAVPRRKWSGKVLDVGLVPQVETSGIQTTTSQVVQYPVTVEINSKEMNLKPGFQLIMNIETDKKQSLVLPADSIIQKGEAHYVYTVKENVAQLTEVEVGIGSNNLIEVTDGITQRDQVIANPPNILKDGSEVTVK